MAVGTPRRWSEWAIVVARIFLATTLLLRTAIRIPHPMFHPDLLFSLELILGTAIAVGWLIQYAAALVLLATVVVSVLPLHLHLALLLPNAETTVAVLIASGILVCFGQNHSSIDAAPIEENNKSSNEHSRILPHDPWYEDFDVTVRLENCLIRSLRRHRCIVTIRDHVGSHKRSNRPRHWKE